MRRFLKWAALAVVVLPLAGFGWLSYRMGGVDQAYGLLRYGRPQMREVELKVGDTAPDASLVGRNASTSST
jgi:hypothetical protein